MYHVLMYSYIVAIKNVGPGAGYLDAQKIVLGSNKFQYLLDEFLEQYFKAHTDEKWLLGRQLDDLTYSKFIGVRNRVQTN